MFDGLPLERIAGWIINLAAIAVIVAFVLNKLKASGIGSFIGERVRDTVDFSQEQKLFELERQRQDAIAIITENAHLTELQSKQLTKTIDFILELDREWHRTHDQRYQQVADNTTSINYLVKQIAEKITVLISVVEGLYDRMKQHRNEEVAELRLQIEQQNQYITALESQIEMRDDKE